MEEILKMLRQTADGVYTVDDQQRIICWNKPAENLLGYTAEEVNGRFCYEVIAGRDAEGNLICQPDCAPLAASTRGEPVPSFDALVRRKDGRRFWVNMSIIAAPEPGERLRGVVHLFRDISVEKQAEAFAADVAARVQQLRLQQPPLRQPVPLARNTTVPVTDISPTLRSAQGRLLEQLTPRELQVLELLARGADTETIATELVISEATVRNHIQHILQKLGVHSRLEAVAYAHEHRLI